MLDVSEQHQSVVAEKVGDEVIWTAESTGRYCRIFEREVSG